MGYHNEANPTEAQLEGELTSVFKSAFENDEQFLHQCVQAAKYLSQPLQTGLAELENTLQTTVGLELDRLLDHYRGRAKQGMSGQKLEAHLKHLLSSEMTRQEAMCGFNLFQCTGENTGEQTEYPDGKVPTYAGFIQPDQFRQQISVGAHWKDPGVPGKHGEYTHRIQWYLMSKGLKSVIGEKPVTFFRKIGAIVNPEDSNTGLWDALFDRELTAQFPFKVTQGTPDFRSPESFTEYVIDEKREQEFPILHWFIRARLKKRELTPINNHYYAKQYVEKKIGKFALNETAEDILGKRRQFQKSIGKRVINPGELIQRLDAVVQDK